MYTQNVHTMKDSIINVRIGSLSKEEFKEVCDAEGVTMSNKIVDLIVEYTYKGKTLKSRLVKMLLNELLPMVLFETTVDARVAIQSYLDEHLVFNCQVSELKISDDTYIASGFVDFADGDTSRTIAFSIIPNAVLIPKNEILPDSQSLT